MDSGDLVEKANYEEEVDLEANFGGVEGLGLRKIFMGMEGLVEKIGFDIGFQNFGVSH